MRGIIRPLRIVEVQRITGERVGLDGIPNGVGQIRAGFHHDHLPAGPVDIEPELICQTDIVQRTNASTRTGLNATMRMGKRHRKARVTTESRWGRGRRGNSVGVASPLGSHTKFALARPM